VSTALAHDAVGNADGLHLTEAGDHLVAVATWEASASSFG
jgi:hypothetical protein